MKRTSGHWRRSENTLCGAVTTLTEKGRMCCNAQAIRLPAFWKRGAKKRVTLNLSTLFVSKEYSSICLCMYKVYHTAAEKYQDFMLGYCRGKHTGRFFSSNCTSIISIFPLRHTKCIPKTTDTGKVIVLTENIARLCWKYNIPMWLKSNLYDCIWSLQPQTHLHSVGV